MTNKIFSGVATAVITPFKEEKIDYDAFETILEKQIESGIDAVVVCGTTGEAPTLSENEKKSIFEFVVRYVGGRIPVICGTGTNSHSVSMRLSSYAAEVGADGLLCVSPYYNKGTDRGIELCYRELCSIGIPVILYNIPSRSGVDIKGDALLRLADEENLVGIKECAGITRISSHKVEFGDRYLLYSGNDSEFLPSLAVGADGIVSVISNVCPRRVKRIYELYSSQKNKDALDEFHTIARLSELLFEQSNPAPAKFAMSVLGLCENSLRLPMAPISGELCRKIENELKKLK